LHIEPAHLDAVGVVNQGVEGAFGQRGIAPIPDDTLGWL
jgi:hypothetical protein